MTVPMQYNAVPAIMTTRSTPPCSLVASPDVFTSADHQRLAPLDLVRDAIWILDVDHHRLYWANEAAVTLWRAHSRQALLAHDIRPHIVPSMALRLAQYQADFIDHDARFDEPWTIYPGHQPITLNMHFSGYRLPDGRMAMLCQGRAVDPGSSCAVRSVEALQHTQVMISLFRLDGVPLYRNPTARTSARALDERLTDRFADAATGQRLLAQVVELGDAKLTMPMMTSQGQRWHEVSARLQHDVATGDLSVLVSEFDVTPMKESEAKAQFLSAHDTLTGLSNREAIRRHYDELFAETPQHGLLQAALILIDLDRFKDINDAQGHAAGDELLVQVAARLRHTVRANDLVARIGGDEFLILVHGPDLRTAIQRLDHRLRAAISQPIRVRDTLVHASAAIGVSLCPDDGTDFDTLLQRADMAMYAAKAGGPNALAFYESHMGTALLARTAMEADLREALVHRQFTLYYQPRVSLSTGRIVGAEALLRWHHPQRGLVSPREFIPLCESTGLIHELGRQVFDMAARQQADWHMRGLVLKLSVNLSPREFDAPDLLASLERTLATTGCPPDALQLEVTESMLMRTDDQPQHTLQAMRTLGLSIALDDFGTGYSNLAYLQRLPFDVLKIDQTFVQADPQERPLAEAITVMGRMMGLSIVAEGVETDEQLAWLTRIGVTEYQGYLFAKPLPVDAFEALLSQQA